MNRISPKALNADNLTRGFLEEIRPPSQREQEETPALGLIVCVIISAEIWAAMFEIYWLLRIYL